MAQKKTLIIKLHQDVSDIPDHVIEAQKVLTEHAARNMSGFNDISFELLVSDEEAQMDRLIQNVRQEFRVCDSAPGAGDDKED